MQNLSYMSVLQIINRSDGSMPGAQDSGQWFYGRIGNHFGNLPANYVEAMDAYSRVTGFCFVSCRIWDSSAAHISRDRLLTKFFQKSPNGPLMAHDYPHARNL